MQAIIRNTKDLKEFVNLNHVESIDSILPELADKQAIVSEKMAKLVQDLSSMPELLAG